VLPMNRTMYELRHDRTRGKRLSFRAIVYNVRAFTNRFYLPRLNKAVRELSYLRFGEEAKFQQAARDLPATDEQGELATS
jgi:hypothetical protein